MEHTQTTTIPPEIRAPAERAAYCRERALDFVRQANAAADEESRFELFNLAERWMTLAFQHRRAARD
jgi:hypothetical protein